MTVEHAENKKNLIRTILSKIRLGFEMWEIFTAFTLALTIASILMWFSNLQPRHIQREFTWQDQNKNSLYNISLKVEAAENQSAMTTAYTPSKSPGNCFENEFTKSQMEMGLNTPESYLNEINENLKQIQKDSESYHDYVEPNPNFDSLTKSLNYFIDDVKEQQRANELLIKKDIELKVFLSKLCLNNYSVELIDTSIFNSFKELASDSNFTNKEIYLYTTKLITNSLGQLKENKDPQKIELFTSSLNKNIAELFALELKSDTSFGKLETSDFNRKIKDYEIWQKQFLAQNPSLGKKTVFIYQDKKSS